MDLEITTDPTYLEEITRELEAYWKTQEANSQGKPLHRGPYIPYNPTARDKLLSFTIKQLSNYYWLL